MRYEIPREIFKQRLNDKLNFAIIDVQDAGRAGKLKFEGTVNIPFGSDFAKTFAGQYPSKQQNVILFSLTPGDEAPQQAADALEAAGYSFVYYYRGSGQDVVLDKGLN